MPDTELELRRLELAEKELEIKQQELALKREQDSMRSTLRSPFGVAAVGGFLTLLAALIGNLFQGINSTNLQRSQHAATENLERQKQQSELVLKAIDTGGDNEKARLNLQFFVEAGLLEDNGKISALVERASAAQGEVIIPSISSRAGQRSKEIRYFIEEAPTVSGANAHDLVSTAMVAWQRVARIRAIQVNSLSAANVVIRRADEPELVAYSFVGPPTDGSLLEIRLSHEFAWSPETFRAAVCREFGHVLGLSNTDTPDQLMSADATLDTLPREPQAEDIDRVREIWGSDS